MVITVGIQYVNEVEKLLQNKKEKKPYLIFLGILVGHHCKVNQSAKNLVTQQ